ncbi:hypothetical protein [Flammeovirga sp. SJP92]|uniref:hypothetical protein n=1 Tax=Flammeovirga sp. SJP92 TaxID=1775430 RepID=UPI0007893AE7|nr:hypothetical protein [Flammeovirga sp. SJP92]KXX71534.1 hypothetical protein AVL50_04490 [Flammeovirga sp. SJP92]
MLKRSLIVALLFNLFLFQSCSDSKEEVFPEELQKVADILIGSKWTVEESYMKCGDKEYEAEVTFNADGTMFTKNVYGEYVTIEDGESCSVQVVEETGAWEWVEFGKVLKVTNDGSEFILKITSVSENKITLYFEVEDETSTLVK